MVAWSWTNLGMNQEFCESIAFSFHMPLFMRQSARTFYVFQYIITLLISWSTITNFDCAPLLGLVFLVLKIPCDFYLGQFGGLAPLKLIDNQLPSASTTISLVKRQICIIIYGVRTLGTDTDRRSCVNIQIPR